MQESSPLVSPEISTPGMDSPHVEMQHPNPQNKPNYWKGIALFLGVVVLVGGFVMGYFYLTGTTSQGEDYQLYDSSKLSASSLPSPSLQPVEVDPTANWKEVSSETWNFKIPLTMNYVLCESQDLLLVAPENNNPGSMFDQDKTIECNFDQTSSLISINRYPDDAVFIPTNTDPQFDPVVSEQENSIIDGVPAIMQKETTATGQGAGTVYSVYIQKNNHTDVITLNDVTQKEVFVQILETFRSI